MKIHSALCFASVFVVACSSSSSDTSSGATSSQASGSTSVGSGGTTSSTTSTTSTGSTSAAGGGGGTSASTGGSSQTSGSTGSGGQGGAAPGEPDCVKTWPDATTTGVPSMVVLTNDSGGVVLNTNGATYEGKDLKGSIVVMADNVTIKNSKIHDDNYKDGYAIRGLGKNLTVDHCEIYSEQKNVSYTGVSGDGGVTLRYSNIYNFENAAIIGSDWLFEKNFVHDLVINNVAHPDGVEWGGSGNGSTVQCNRFTVQKDTTSCVNVTPYGGGNAKNNAVKNNYFSGGGYSLYLRGDGGGKVDGIEVSGNVWVKGSYQYGTHSVVDVTNLTWTNNVYDDGTPVAQ